MLQMILLLGRDKQDSVEMKPVRLRICVTVLYQLSSSYSVPS